MNAKTLYDKLWDVHVIRNAGGRASDDATRSLVISYKLLGTQEWFIIHHTHCGMETFSSLVSFSIGSSDSSSRRRCTKPST